MIKLLRIIINFDGKSIKFEIDKEKVKTIKINEKEGLIKVCYEESSNLKFLKIPIILLDFYNYDRL